MRLANLTNKFFLISAVILFLTISTQTSALKIEDDRVAQQKLYLDAQLLLHQEKYDELEKLANTLRKTKARFPGGGWKIGRFYDGCSNSYYGWEELFRNLNKWMMKYPNSITAKVAASSAWSSYAWEARGGGYANTVGEKQWKLWDERMAKAYNLIKDDPANPKNDCPCRYFELLSITPHAKGWDRKNYEALFQKAIAYEPSFWGYYIVKSLKIIPRWYGEEGEWQKFAAEAAQMTSKKEGLGIYARIIMHMWDINEFKTFREPDISWKKTKQGFLDLERRYSNIPNHLNWFCLLSCVAGDKETARKLFKRIGDNPYTEIWKGRSNYEKWKRWAMM